MFQPCLPSFLLEPRLIHFMFWVLDFPQFTQKKPQIVFRDGNLFDMVVYRVAVLTNVLGNRQLPGAVVVSQTLGDQECRMGKISQEIGVDVVVQLFRGQPRLARLISSRISCRNNSMASAALKIEKSTCFSCDAATVPSRSRP